MFFLFARPEAFEDFMTTKFPGRRQVEEFVDVIRGVDPSMTVGSLATFVFVANRLPKLSSGEISLSDIAAEMGVPYTTVTRQVDLLAAGVPPVVRGLNLLEKRLHPSNRRQREIGLTEEGQNLLERLSRVFAAMPANPSATRPAGGDRMIQTVMPGRPTSRKYRRKSPKSKDSGNS